MPTPTIHGTDLGTLRVSDLLPETSRLISERSGGPPAVGATQVYDANELPVWSALAGEYLSDESGNQLVDESGIILIG